MKYCNKLYNEVIHQACSPHLVGNEFNQIVEFFNLKMHY